MLSNYLLVYYTATISLQKSKIYPRITKESMHPLTQPPRHFLLQYFDQQGWSCQFHSQLSSQQFHAPLRNYNCCQFSQPASSYAHETDLILRVISHVKETLHLDLHLN